MVGAAVTDVPGSSSVFWGSVVSYAYEAKEQVLGVRRETIDRYGAVSDACVREMADGVRRLSGSDLAVSVSGIAGPEGGTSEKPVGTVWFAVSTREGTTAQSTVFPGGRDQVRGRAVVEALLQVRRAVPLA
jgi:PncC family amidohydrolase